MPSLTISQSIAATTNNVNVLAGTSYEFLPFPARIKLLGKTTAVGMTHQVLSGVESIMDPSPVPVVATAGATPSEFQVHPVIFDAPAGDRIKVLVSNTTGGALFYDAFVHIEPLG